MIWASLPASLSRKHYVNKNKFFAKQRSKPSRFWSKHLWFSSEKNDRSFYHRENDLYHRENWSLIQRKMIIQLPIGYLMNFSITANLVIRMNATSDKRESESGTAWK